MANEDREQVGHQFVQLMERAAYVVDAEIRRGGLAGAQRVFGQTLINVTADFLRHPDPSHHWVAVLAGFYWVMVNSPDADTLGGSGVANAA